MITTALRGKQRYLTVGALALATLTAAITLSQENPPHRTSLGDTIAYSDASASPPTYQTNASGETYGSSAGAIPDDWPDLIDATGQASDGSIVDGYVLKSDLMAATGDDVTNPQQAIAWTNSHIGKAGASTIPLYAQDGHTVIGTFSVSGVEVGAPGITTTTNPAASSTSVTSAVGTEPSP